jgi:hypothetical protein
MEQLQNFGPNDVQNGTLAQMFRHAGIEDVNSYVSDVRHENNDLNDQSILMANNSDLNSHSSHSNRLGGFLNNAQQMFGKQSDGKGGLGNVKQMYKLVRKKKSVFIHFLFLLV